MHKKGSFFTGFILITLGFFFLAAQIFPPLATWINFSALWPLIVLGTGGIFLVAAVGGTPPLAIPGSIVTGVGVILLYQNSTGNWDHWQLWLLVNCFIGAGILLTSLLEGRGVRGAMPAAGILLAIGLVLFFVFALADFWPVLLILVGLSMLWRNLGRAHKTADH